MLRPGKPGFYASPGVVKRQLASGSVSNGSCQVLGLWLAFTYT